MAKIWVIAPCNYHLREEFKHIWNYDRQNGVIAIGWGIEDAHKMSREDLEAKFLEQSHWNPQDRHQVIKFYHDIQPGDRIIARGGRKKIVGIGTVTHRAFFDRKRGLKRSGDWGNLENFLCVNWEGGKTDFPNQVFGMQTVTELKESSKHWLAIKAALGNVWNLP